MNAWLSQASYPCSGFLDTSRWIPFNIRIDRACFHGSQPYWKWESSKLYPVRWHEVTNAWLSQASYPCGGFFDTSRWIPFNIRIDRACFHGSQSYWKSESSKLSPVRWHEVMNAWLSQASYPCGGFFDTNSRWIPFNIRIDRACFHGSQSYRKSESSKLSPVRWPEVSVLIELTRGHLCYYKF